MVNVTLRGARLCEPQHIRSLEILELMSGSGGENVLLVTDPRGRIQESSRRREEADGCVHIEFRLLTSAATGFRQFLESALQTRQTRAPLKF